LQKEIEELQQGSNFEDSIGILQRFLVAGATSSSKTLVLISAEFTNQVTT
jgi:hypothetical protein